MEIRVLKNNILFKADFNKTETKSPSGIIYKETVKVNYGTVVAIGPDVPMSSISVGDKILLDWKNVTKVQDDLCLVSFLNIHAVMHGDSDV